MHTILIHMYLLLFLFVFSEINTLRFLNKQENYKHLKEFEEFKLLRLKNIGHYYFFIFIYM